MPLPCLHALGTILGFVAVCVPHRARSAAKRNIDLCFPQLTTQQRRALLRRSFIETGKGFLEVSVFWLGNKSKALGMIREVEGDAVWQKALQEAQGVIMLSPHLGAWELALVYLARNCGITCMYRQSRLGSEFDDLVRSWRERHGAKLVPADTGGVRSLIKVLRQGGVIGLLPDQNPAQGEGVFAPFFGYPAYTMTLLSRLAMRDRVPVFAVCVERLPRARGFKLRLIAIPEISNTDSLQHSVTALNHAIERMVKQIPAQYLWLYKRFKSRPAGSEKLY